MKTQLGIVEGYRLYSVVKGKKDDFLLGSLNSGPIFPRKINKASHRGGFGVTELNIQSLCPHEVKDIYSKHANPRCGFNMFKYEPYINESIFEPEFHGYLIGKGYGWGKVVPGERGFRCQFFYPKSIFGVINAPMEEFMSANRNPKWNVLSLSDLKLRVYKGSTVYRFLPDEFHEGLPINILQVLWKIARLYRINLEFELPEWTIRKTIGVS